MDGKFRSPTVNRDYTEWVDQDRSSQRILALLFLSYSKLRNDVFLARLRGSITVFTKIFLVEANVISWTQKNPFHLWFPTISFWTKVPQGLLSGREEEWSSCPTAFLLLLLLKKPTAICAAQEKRKEKHLLYL